MFCRFSAVFLPMFCRCSATLTFGAKKKIRPTENGAHRGLKNAVWTVLRLGQCWDPVEALHSAGDAEPNARFRARFGAIWAAHPVAPAAFTPRRRGRIPLLVQRCERWWADAAATPRVSGHVAAPQHVARTPAVWARVRVAAVAIFFVSAFRAPVRCQGRAAWRVLRLSCLCSIGGACGAAIGRARSAESWGCRRRKRCRHARVAPGIIFRACFRGFSLCCRCVKPSRWPRSTAGRRRRRRPARQCRCRAT